LTISSRINNELTGEGIQGEEHTLKNDAIPAVPAAVVAHLFVFHHCVMHKSPVYTPQFYSSCFFPFKPSQSVNFPIGYYQ